jgi:hypothetical protein
MIGGSPTVSIPPVLAIVVAAEALVGPLQAKILVTIAPFLTGLASVVVMPPDVSAIDGPPRGVNIAA